MKHILLALLALHQLPLYAADAPFRAAAGKVDITPAIGTPMAGFYAMRESIGVLEPLYAKAIVAEQGGEKAVFVVLDVAYTPRALVVATRALIEKQTGIAGERVMITATHTHSGPTLPRDSIMDDITGGKSPAVVDYMNKLPALIAQVVANANSNLAPAKAMATIGREENLSFNRRFVMKDGTFSWQGKKLNPEILRPAGPIDPDVGIWQLTSSDNKATPLATYVNFAMHPTIIGGLKFSPDYPGYLAKRLEAYYGSDMLTFFANGCCGNINQNNIKWGADQHGPREAERVGTMLSAAVFRALPDLQPLKTFAPRVRSQMVTLRRRTYSADEIADARRIALRMSDPQFDTPAKARAVCILDTVAKQDEPLDVEVQAIAVGEELAIVALPGEIFVELGISLKNASPFKQTFIAELANGSIGYIPNRGAYSEGLYEVFSARCTEGSGEVLVEEALKLLNDLAIR